MERRFISPREASQYTGAHIMSIYSWIASGEIKASRLGRRILIDKELLDTRLLENQAVPVVGGRRGTRR